MLLRKRSVKLQLLYMSAIWSQCTEGSVEIGMKFLLTIKIQVLDWFGFFNYYAQERFLEKGSYKST